MAAYEDFLNDLFEGAPDGCLGFNLDTERQKERLVHGRGCARGL